jgi:hypothetical protein
MRTYYLWLSNMPGIGRDWGRSEYTMQLILGFTIWFRYGTWELHRLWGLANDMESWQFKREQLLEYNRSFGAVQN